MEFGKFSGMGGGGGSETLAQVSAASLTTPNSLYTMTSTIPVEFKTSGGTHLLYLDESNARVGIGTNAPAFPLTVVGAYSGGDSPNIAAISTTPVLKLNKQGQLNIEAVTASSSANDSPVFLPLRSRGTLASPSAVSNNDRLFLFGAAGYGSGWDNIATGMLIEVDGAPSGIHMPTRMSFIGENTSFAAITWMSFFSNTTVGINQTVPGAQLHINSVAASTKTLILQGASSQSANMQEWQDSTGAVIARITPPSTTNTYLGITTLTLGYDMRVGASNTDGVYITNATFAGLSFPGANTIQPMAGGTRVDASVALGNPSFRFKDYYGMFAVLSNVGGSASDKVLILKGAASQSGNLQEWQKSDGTLYLRVNSVGDLLTQNTGIIGSDGALNLQSGGNAFSISYKALFHQFYQADGNGNNVTIYGGTAAAQAMYVTPTAAGMTGLIVQGFASRTVAILQLQTPAGASLGNVGGSIFNSFTTTSTTHTDGTEDDLYSYTTVANTFAINGDAVQETEHMSTVASATATRRIKKYFAGTLIFDSGALTLALGTDFVITTIVIRESSTVVRCSVEVTTTSASTVPYATYTRITGLTLTGTNILKTTGIAAGTGAASADISDLLAKVVTLQAA